MKTSFTAAALVAASLAFATSASAHQVDRSSVAPAVTSQAFSATSTQNSDGRFVVATAGDATGGPSGGPNQNGG